jgi:transcriptional regulator with PAS, ATPase and Fis domain
VNSIAIPDTLLESEFFGHVKGAFTDAKEDKKGYFELAHGGTLFLDEIADMPFRLQGKLLRAIEEKQIIPVGSDKMIQFDARIISATNKNIQQMINDYKFRQDFFHRINAFNIHIPPLKDRPEDVKPLLEYYVQYFARKKNRPVPLVQKSDVKMLEKYRFPGNVRELRNIIERAFLISNGNSLDIPASMGFFQEIPTQITDSFNLSENEKNLIEKALIATNFHQIEAAKLLCISRDSLLRRMKKYNIAISKKL